LKSCSAATLEGAVSVCTELLAAMHPKLALINIWTEQRYKHYRELIILI